MSYDQIKRWAFQWNSLEKWEEEIGNTLKFLFSQTQFEHDYPYIYLLRKAENIHVWVDTDWE